MDAAKTASVTFEDADDEDPPDPPPPPPTCQPPMPPETRNLETTTTSWTYPSSGVTHKEVVTTTQPQRSTVTCNTETMQWEATPWENHGRPSVSDPVRKGTKNVGDMPEETLPPVPVSQTQDAASGCGDTETRTGTRTDTRTVGWDSSTGNWTTGDPVQGDPDWGDWVVSVGSRPAKPATSQTITVGNAAIQWVVRGMTAYEQSRSLKQFQIQTVTWSGKPQCKWIEGGWTNFLAPYWTLWVDTGDTNPKPPPGTVLVHSQPTTQTRWVEEIIGICILWEEQRTRSWTRLYDKSWRWSASAIDWVSQLTPNPLGVAYYTYTEWTRTGKATACGGGLRSESVALTAGDYTLPWGLQRISFTVPKKADVQLSLRTLDSGVQAVVLRSAAGAELVLYPGALADGARPTPSVADTTLSSIAATLTLTEVALVAPPAPPASEECAVVTAADSGATAVDLDASHCAEVPTGALVVTVGGHTLPLTLPTGYDWLLLRVSPDPAVVGVIDVASGAYLALNAETGAEEAREVGEDVAETIGPIFDAIVTSAGPP